MIVSNQTFRKYGKIESENATSDFLRIRTMIKSIKPSLRYISKDENISGQRDIHMKYGKRKQDTQNLPINETTHFYYTTDVHKNGHTSIISRCR